MEAAGLVLGAIPLAISAMSSYHDILSNVKNAERDLEYMIRDLSTEQEILQNTCGALLEGIAPDSVVDDMIQDPFGPAWSQYNDDVRLRLWRSSDILQERVAEMKQATVDLRQKLAIDQGGKVASHDLRLISPVPDQRLIIGQTRINDRRSLLHELKYGAYFTLKKKDYAEIMSRLKEGNAALATLVRQNRSSERSGRTRSQAKLTRLIRKLSQGLYWAIQSVMTCNCTNPHGLGLEMEPRRDMIFPGDEEDKAAKSLDFVVVIGSSAQHEHQRWDKISARLAVDENALLPIPPTTPSPQLPQSRPSRIRWKLPSTFKPLQSLGSNTKKQSASNLSVPTHHTGSATLQPSLITNLCHALHKGRPKMKVAECYGYVSNQESNFKIYHHDCQPECLSAISLRAVLDGQCSYLNQFTYARKLKAAISLSYSVLHFYNTPWLARIVTADDIMFIMEQHAAADSLANCLDRPFLTKEASKSSQTSFHPSNSTSRPIDLIILSLGLLLIQIIVGRSIDDLAIDPNVKDMDPLFTKRATATRMAGSVVEQGGCNYAGAVQWCLNRVQSVACLDDETLAQEFHEAVIGPLEKDWGFQASTTSTS